MSDLIPNEYTLPQDLKNVGVKCYDCRSAQVVYHITVPDPKFPLGVYCYPCLRQRCGAAKRIPVPMETGLMDRLEVDLGILPGVKKFYTLP